MSLYCCSLRLCPTGASGVHRSISSTTSGPLGASVLYGAQRLPQALHAHVTSYFEAGACSKIVQNLLRVRYEHDSATSLETPSYPVLRNLLRNLRKKNAVLACDVPMTGPGRAPASNLPDADISGVAVGSLDEPPLELGANIDVAELLAFCEAYDFKVWLSARNQYVPSLGLAPGGEDGQHSALGHNLITFSGFSNERCVTAFNERILLSTVLECIKACHDPLYHLTNPEYGLWEHRKYGLVLSSDDTYKIDYGGDISWELAALCVTVVNLSNDTSIRGSKKHGVTNRSLPLMFQYQK